MARGKGAPCVRDLPGFERGDILKYVLTSFSPTFSPTELCGWRARQFAEREDCFQQLLGDAFREVHGLAVHVSPTRGRDGSIDIWVEQPLPECPLLGGVQGPVIIECKDHEQKPEWPSTWRNIQAGWRAVQSKLERQADGGFAGKFEPWRRARTYVYCISAVVPDQQSKDELTRVIGDFLETTAPGIRKVIVLDWGSLSSWLNTLRRVADNWLGIGFLGIAGHQEYVASLTGFRRYLLSENLAYEPPEPNADTHPDVVWKLLSADDECCKPGLVLYGPSGVGKSRLCVEVAERAHAGGWRVLHVSPAEESLGGKDLMSVIAAGARPTLVCFDYLDFMYGVDYISVGGRLVRDAAHRGVRLRYLANSRPMWAESALRNPTALEVYSFLELKTVGGQWERLLRRIIQTVAPRALEKWGVTELLRVCGGRPIIVLLIAREIERRLADGTLEGGELQAARGGDLSVWLRKRLAGDELTIPEPASFWEPSAPPDPMVAACAALVAAPNRRETLVAAADAALQSIESRTNAEFVIRQLTKMGWLEPTTSRFATPHDVVADEVFDQTVRDVDQIRERVLTAVLSLWVCDHGAIGRLATALRRWIGAASPRPAAVEKAESFLAEWLQTHAKPIGALLAAGHPDVTGFALGSILKGWPWSEAAVQCWDELTAPWLVANQRRPEARHVLYSGLNEESVALRMVPHAIVWLDAHSSEDVASYVLQPLLGRSDLAKEQAETAIGRALAWLAQFPLEKEAPFVLHPLLGRSDLAKEQAETAIERALAWLAQFPLEKEAGFILPPLLGRRDLTDSADNSAISLALSWLPGFLDEQDAEFALKHVLRRRGLPVDRIGDLKRRAIAQLRRRVRNPNDEGVSFLLRPWLRCQVRHPELDREIISLAGEWLRADPGRTGADFVFNRILRQKDTPDTEWLLAAQSAADWLRIQGRSHGEEDFAINSLLTRGYLQPRELLEFVIDRGLRLLQSERNEDSRVHLASRLLRAVEHLPSDDPLALSVRQLAQPIHAAAGGDET